MTDEQIIELVKEHFIEEEVDDDGYMMFCFAKCFGDFNLQFTM